MWRDEAADPPAIVCQVGRTTLKYDAARHRRPARLAEGDRATGSIWARPTRQKPAHGSVEAWGRDEGNPVGGWYGLKKG